MKLVIAEKPSVAAAIAAVIGANKKENGHYQGNGYVVSWCVGHLVQLAPPENYDDIYKKWDLATLPIIPSIYKTVISNNTKEQYQHLKQLMERADIEELIEATDAGREGELIFRLVYDKAKCKKPFKRLWISSMEEEAIKKGFAELRPSAAYDN
jgi:DNA topoisomerase-3